MVVIDSHTHTKFSFDSRAEPEEMVQSAIRKGIKTLCFTEHLDISYKNEHSNFSPRFNAYFAEANRIRDKYEGEIEIIIGLEAGYSRYASIVKRIIESYPFEYIINSVHDNGFDYFSPQVYVDDKFSVYEEYLEVVYESLSAPYRFDAIGHLGYPSRAATYADNAWHYSEHRQTLDKLLKKIIEKEIILEVNTSVYRSAHPFLPSEEILARYYQLGGRFITFSSDSHSPASLARKYPETIKKLNEIGFTHLTKCKSGEKELLEI